MTLQEVGMNRSSFILKTQRLSKCTKNFIRFEKRTLVLCWRCMTTCENESLKSI